MVKSLKSQPSLRLASRALLRLLPLAALVLASAPAAFAEGLELPPPPAFLRLLEHPSDVRTEPGFRQDELLQARLESAIVRLGLKPLVDSGKLGLALVDLADEAAPRLAAMNGASMIYAASVPKIAVLYAAFEAQREGRLRIDDGFRATLTDMIRVSSNTAASAAIQRVGFDFIGSLLWTSGLYDPRKGGGLWVGKGYGGRNDSWRRDPVKNTSHGATPLSLASLLTLLAQERLVDAPSSRAMKEILGDPRLHHKFVRGLDARPGSRIFRKSGTWRTWHGDAALVERADKRYVAVALCEDPQGSKLLERLIVELDDCIAPATTAAAARAGL